jgi:hypothetical protein
VVARARHDVEAGGGLQVCLELDGQRAPNTHSSAVAAIACPHRPATAPSRLRRSAPVGAMWDDEDNNPYGSFARHDANPHDEPGPPSPAACKPCEPPARVACNA